MKMFEIESKIQGFEDYTVSSWGRVRSYKNGKTRILKPGKQGNGYLHVTLCKDGKTKKLLVHRLVADAFIPNPQNYPCVNHRDEDKTNNHVDNLEFCSFRYNNCYGTVLKRRAAKKSKSILQYDKQGNFLKQWPSAREVERTLGFNDSNICLCCNGKLKSAYKFVWKYA